MTPNLNAWKTSHPLLWCLNRFIVQQLCRAETLSELHCSLFSSPVCHPRQLVADLRAARSCILFIEWACPSSCLPKGELHCFGLCNRLKAGGTGPETASVLNLAQENEAVLWQHVWLRGGGCSCNDFVRAGLLEVLFWGTGRWMLSLGKGGFHAQWYKCIQYYLNKRIPSCWEDSALSCGKTAAPGQC